jgi:hypothetical protein
MSLIFFFSDIFIGLNAVRTLSIIALLLVFSSSIFVMVTDIQAVNYFQAAGHAGNSTMNDLQDCDYIEYAPHFPLVPQFVCSIVHY